VLELLASRPNGVNQLNLSIRLYLPDGLVMPDGSGSTNPLRLGMDLLPARTPLAAHPCLVRLRAVTFDAPDEIIEIMAECDLYGAEPELSPDEPMLLHLSLVNGTPVVEQVEALVPATHFETLTTWCPATAKLDMDPRRATAINRKRAAVVADWRSGQPLKDDRR
jgi:hypothetical protein